MTPPQNLSDEVKHQQEEFKRRMGDTWAAAAPGYAESVIDNHLVDGLCAMFEQELVPALKGRSGVRILDLASANGEPAATLAAALPDAQVLSTDFAAAFLPLGQARAAKLGLANISFETADAEDLHRYSDASFDAVTCSLGLMFMPDYETAVEEMARVLKPGGIFAATVWQKQEKVPFFSLVLDMSVEYAPDAVPASASTTGVHFDDPTRLLEAIGAAGLGETACRELSLAFVMPQEWWSFLLNMPFPLNMALKKAQERRPGEDVFEEVHGKMRERFAAIGWLKEDGSVHCTNNGCWFITAKKAAMV